MTVPSNYDAIRATVQQAGSDSRVEVNQRALIDKILARYASSGAVYRELLQNSNDAEATIAEIHFATATESKIVQQVMYRNNGIPFRPQDWSRLQKIAEGNPDVSKVGAFGVGAYTMFSICEEPLVVSGSTSLCFVWKGDALWCKTAPLPAGTKPSKWTSFVLPSRDPYPLPDLVEFGEFLCASLTFTQCLKHIRVLVNDKERLVITKTIVQEPQLVSTPKSSSWWSNQGAAVTTTPKGTFALSTTGSASEHSIYESIHRITVQLDGTASSMDARYVSATAKTRIGHDMARRMERVTKKQPPKQVQLQLFLNATRHVQRPRTGAEQITQSFSPKPGAGRIFIGFRTSQTTGLAAHVAAPFVPTVEREAMDLQDPTLKVFNVELLEMAGILLRLTLEHNMYSQVDVAWKEHKVEREALEESLRQEEQARRRSKEPKEVAASVDEAIAEEAPDLESTTSSSGLMGFARFMARGVKKKIVSVVNTVEKIMDDGSDLLNPSDARPLSAEEEDAIVLMQSFCPMQSTPDPLVGTALAQGFSRCLPDQVPPVLTRAGVVRGNDARLPNSGIEAFVKDNVVRSVVYKNCEEYHSVIAGCRKVTLTDLLKMIGDKPMEEEDVVLLIKWLTKFKRIDPNGVGSLGPSIKEAIRYYPADSKRKNSSGEREDIALSGLLFFVEKDSMLASATLPMPDTVLPARLRDEIGPATLSDPTIRKWFSNLPVEIWADFISSHPSMTDARPEDERLRVETLSVLCQEYSRRSVREREVFGSFCSSLLSNRRCIPFDSDEPTQYAAEKAPDLYLYSAELKAFEGIGSFYKVAASLKSAGVTEEFLLCLGVRKSVSIDFLFANLELLKWSSDPKPLVEYLRTATLTRDDMRKLASTQYLPADKESSRLFAPSELYLPNPELRVFPFLRVLRWPSDELSERSDNGKFLKSIGMKHEPPLLQVLEYISTADIDIPTRIKCFDFLCDRLGPHGVYQAEYSRLSYSKKKSFRFLPCVVSHPFEQETSSSVLQSSLHCFSESSAGIMGFPVIDPKLGDNAKLYGSLFLCAPEPEASLLMHQLAHLVSSAKIMQQKAKKDPTGHIISAFSAIFKYLSHRAPEIDESALERLKSESFIPCVVGGTILWFRPNQVFFRSSDPNADAITGELFHVIDFSPFLAAAGVKQEATTADLFKLMLASPQDVLKTLGSEVKYRSLLRRIAANPPFRNITQEMRQCPFLLAYTIKASDNKSSSGSGDNATYHLAKAEDIYIIDNSFFGRMFSVNRAPHESDLEDFYASLGSPYISKSVDRRFEVVGVPGNETQLTLALKKRLQERSPLLVSPNITTRPLVKNAPSLLSEKNLTLYQASNLMAVYSLRGVTRRNRTTCCLRHVEGNKNAIFVVKDFDFFDLGNAIGDLILSRCQLEDAFFISSLLEAPLEQLRARGFPVDRIIQPEPKQPVKTAAAPPSVPQTVSTTTTRNDPAAAAAASAATAPPDAPSTAKPTEKSNTPSTEGGLEDILFQMFPDSDKEFVRSALGSNPSLDDVRLMADQMASGAYPKASDTTTADDDADTVATETTTRSSKTTTTAGGTAGDSKISPTGSKRNSGIRKRLGKAFGGLRVSNSRLPSSPAMANALSSSPAVGGPAGALGSGIKAPSVSGGGQFSESVNPVSPAVDAQSQTGLEHLLEQTVRTSTKVSRQGVNSQPSQVTASIPEGLDRGDTCEVIPGQSLKPFQGGSGGNGMTLAGIRVFSSAVHGQASERFLQENIDAVEQFSLVLSRLAQVYGLTLDSIAIFHDPSGGTIAFNSNKALHFNLRFFHALHYLSGQADSATCYAYWYVTFAHELAHHLVSAHCKEHGFYTESYASHYLPKLLDLLSSLQQS